MVTVPDSEENLVTIHNWCFNSIWKQSVRLKNGPNCQ